MALGVAAVLLIHKLDVNPCAVRGAVVDVGANVAVGLLFETLPEGIQVPVTNRSGWGGDVVLCDPGSEEYIGQCDEEQQRTLDLERTCLECDLLRDPIAFPIGHWGWTG